MANRLLTINIRNYLVNQPRRKRPMRISTYLKYRIAKSTNIRSSNIRISSELNTLVMKKYINSMKPLKVNVSIDKEIATITPFGQKAAKAQEAKPQEAAKPAVKESGKPQQDAKQKPKEVKESKPKQETAKNDSTKSGASQKNDTKATAKS